MEDTKVSISDLETDIVILFTNMAPRCGLKPPENPKGVLACKFSRIIMKLVSMQC